MRIARLALLVAVAVGVALALTAAAPSRTRPQLKYRVDIQAMFDFAGNPSLVANFSPDGNLALPYWSICPPAPATRCQTAHTPHAILDPGPEPAGTAFTAAATYRGHTFRATVTWQGQVRPTAPPRMIGAPRFAAHIRTAAGTWTGGWGNESDQLGLEACRTASGEGCFTLSGGQYGCPTRSSATVVGAALTGLYLFALDLRFARDTACGGVGWSFPAAIPVWPHRQIVTRSAPAGPVVGPPAPHVTILRHARVERGRLLVASVRCATRCRAWLDVTGRRGGSSANESFTGSRTVGVPGRGLGRGVLSVRVHVDDGPAISGRCRLASDG